MLIIYFLINDSFYLNFIKKINKIKNIFLKNIYYNFDKKEK